MLKISKFILGMAVLGLAIVGCEPDTNLQDISKKAPNANAREGTCGTTTWDLTAGQHTVVGTVTVSNDLNNIYVDLQLTDTSAVFGNLHVWVGNDLLSVPSTPNGAPIPGQFCSADGGVCADATGLTSYSFTIPFTETSWADATKACGASLYVVAHAEVDMDGIEGGDHETAFGGNTAGTGDRWWFYGTYTICCDFGTPDLGSCQTAYAKGGYVWTTDKKSNPEKLPSLNLTKNRWGWAINLTATGVTTYDIWAGAGLNNTKVGTKVGTLTVNWDGTTAVVTYTITVGTLEDVHLYAGDLAPATIAPGQYGNLADPDSNTYTFNVDLADANGTGGVWLAAHAVVCK
jgi:hypothetical protein